MDYIVRRQYNIYAVTSVPNFKNAVAREPAEVKTYHVLFMNIDTYTQPFSRKQLAL